VSVFYTDAGDVRTAVDEMHRELKQERELLGGQYIPEVSKWDFEVSLPVEGFSGTYHWKVRGSYATRYRDRGQRIYGFSGQTMDSESPVKLMSSEMVFDDGEKELWTREPVYAELDWCTVSGTGMKLEWEQNFIEVRNDVEVTLETSEIPEGSGLGDVVGGEGGGGANAEEKDGGKLVITSDKLQILGEKDMAIFTGNVIAKDEQGTIEADVMEVQNYTKEETKADPVKSGVKTVVCKGRVIIDMEDQAAKCHDAVFDSATNMVTLLGREVDGTYVQVEYWNKKEEQQVLADKMIIDRGTREVSWEGHVKTTTFNPEKASFLDFGLGKDEGSEETNGDDDGKEDGGE
jgi:lipopolysaccharide export system protein LptA